MCVGFPALKGRFDLIAMKVKEILSDASVAVRMELSGRSVVEDKFSMNTIIDKYYGLMRRTVSEQICFLC
jgi:hypothetical protein